MVQTKGETLSFSHESPYNIDNYIQPETRYMLIIILIVLFIYIYRKATPKTKSVIYFVVFTQIIKFFARRNRKDQDVTRIEDKKEKPYERLPGDFI
ncbi:MAG: hypothetical protein K5751_07445 [Treponemataceae bacterium]|nr:hypothetical protein [Treponemataceae bacterium]